MTRGDIIRMAKEAGLYTKCEVHSAVPLDQLLTSFAELVSAAEREACLKLFESYETFGEDYDSYYADKYAAMIRARG